MIVPIIIGVGEAKNVPKELTDIVEPIDLMLSAIEKAAQDTTLPSIDGTQLLRDLDGIEVVQSWTWPYDDLPRLIAKRLHADPQRRTYSEAGGNQPAVVLDNAAQAVATGDCQSILVVGGEALASSTSASTLFKNPLTRQWLSMCAPLVRLQQIGQQRRLVQLIVWQDLLLVRDRRFSTV